MTVVLVDQMIGIIADRGRRLVEVGVVVGMTAFLITSF